MFTCRFAPLCAVRCGPTRRHLLRVDHRRRDLSFQRFRVSFSFTRCQHSDDPITSHSVRERPTRRLLPACRGLERERDVVGIYYDADHDRQAEARQITKCRLGVRRRCSLEHHSVTRPGTSSRPACASRQAGFFVATRSVIGRRDTMFVQRDTRLPCRCILCRRRSDAERRTSYEHAGPLSRSRCALTSRGRYDDILARMGLAARHRDP